MRKGYWRPGCLPPKAQRMRGEAEIRRRGEETARLGMRQHHNARVDRFISRRRFLFNAVWTLGTAAAEEEGGEGEGQGGGGEGLGDRGLG